jgi:hypothetical protein
MATKAIPTLRRLGRFFCSLPTGVAEMSVEAGDDGAGPRAGAKPKGSGAPVASSRCVSAVMT